MTTTMCSIGGSRSVPSGRAGSGRCPATRRSVAATGADVGPDPDDFSLPAHALNAASAAAELAPARNSRLDRPSRSFTARRIRASSGCPVCRVAAQWGDHPRAGRLPPPSAHTPESAVVEVRAEITANVWQVPATAGVAVGAGDTIAILESMKMEIPVEAPVAGLIAEVRVAPNDQVNEGDLIALIEPS